MTENEIKIVIDTISKVAFSRICETLFNELSALNDMEIDCGENTKRHLTAEERLEVLERKLGEIVVNTKKDLKL